jgi:hypothetical protein
MEFEELKRVWEMQNSEVLFVVDEKSLHRRIASKKNKANRTLNFTEWLILLANTASATFVLATTFFNSGLRISAYLLSGWMFMTAIYVAISRIRRIKGDSTYDRSMQGDLHHAIAMANHQLRLSQLMRWNTLPVVALVLLVVWEGGKSIWMVAGILTFFALTYVASGWEHRFYQTRKRELEILKGKLENE